MNAKIQIECEVCKQYDTREYDPESHRGMDFGASYSFKNCKDILNFTEYQQDNFYDFSRNFEYVCFKCSALIVDSICETIKNIEKNGHE